MEQTHPSTTLEKVLIVAITHYFLEKWTKSAYAFFVHIST